MSAPGQPVTQLSPMCVSGQPYTKRALLAEIKAELDALSASVLVCKDSLANLAEMVASLTGAVATLQTDVDKLVDNLPKVVGIQVVPGPPTTK